MKTITKKSLQKPALLILFLFVQSFVFAQTSKEAITTDENLTVDNIQCSAGDLRVQRLLLTNALGNPITSSCIINTSQIAFISTILDGPTNGERYSLTLSYDVYYDGVFQESVSNCLYERAVIPTQTVFPIQQIDYNCGTSIDLKNFEIQWNTSKQKPCNKPNRCFKSAVGFSVSSPLIADFSNTDNCSDLTINFMDETSGGKDSSIDSDGNESEVAYSSYLWNFGDGNTKTITNTSDGSTSHTYASAGTYTVTLTVTDSENAISTTQKQVTVSAPFNNLTLSTEQESCTGEANGSITASNVSGGRSPYNYSISPEPNGYSQNDNVFSNIPAGNYTITAEDSRGCSIDKSVTVSVKDSSTPTITAPAQQNVSGCNTEEITNDRTTKLSYSETETEITESQFTQEGGTYNEDNIASITYQDTSSGSCPIVVTRTFKITDECGAMATATQKIRIFDKQPPTLPTPPANITLQCSDDIPDAEKLTARDNCDGDITVKGVDSEVVNGNIRTITRTWTFTDSCNNSDSVSQTITIEDTTKPELPNAPSAENYQCLEDVPAPGQLTAKDNCDDEIKVIGVDSVNDTNPCNVIITRTWTFTDAANNSASVSQTITVKDDTAPVPPPAPKNTSYQCANQVPDAGQLTAIDNCDGNITVSGMDSEVVSGNKTTITRTWTFVDNCDNESSISQIITIEDTDEPNVPVAPADEQYQCLDEVPAPGPLSVSDNCDENITVNGVDKVNDDNPCNIIITRTWTFTDSSGNSDSVSQTITVKDETAPVLPIAPSTESYQCGADVPNAGQLTAVDNCDGNITVDAVDSEVVNGNVTTITRTWTFTDSCDNSSSVSQTIFVEDTTKPDLPTAPADETYQCEDDVPEPGQLSTTDNCDGNITVTGVDSINDDNQCNIIITRTWTFTDTAGNSDEVSQTITVKDTKAPVAPTAPAPQSYQCGADVPSAGQLQANDNCDGIITADGMDSSTTSGNVTTIIRTWTFTDSCNNESSISQTITVEDTTAPVLPNAPANETAQCLEDVADAGNLTAKDNCDGDITVTGIDKVNDENLCNIIITRTWTFKDTAGNSSSVSQTITVKDTIDPDLTQGASNINISCDGDDNDGELQAWLDSNGGAAATDNCGELIWTNTYGDLNSDCSEAIEVTFTATDKCGNSVSTTASYAVIDEKAPSISTQAQNMTVECDGEGNISDLNTFLTTAGNAIATDDCSAVAWSNDFTELSDECGLTGSAFVTFTAIDGCGNTSKTTATFTIQDTTDPSFDAPADIELSCTDDINDLSITGNVQNESDVCSSNIKISYEDEVVSTSDVCEINKTIKRTFTAEDDCGRSSTAFQTITIVDNIAPSFDVPANITIDCNEDVDNLEVTGNVTNLNDSCTSADAITSSYVDSVEDGSCGGERVITRTFTVTDSCGNSDTGIQIITIEDNDGPVIDTPAQSIALECNADGSSGDLQAWLDSNGGASATDTCGGTVSWSNNYGGGSTDCDNAIEVTFTATDECGNSTSTTATYNVEDNTPPVIDTPANNLNVECDGQGNEAEFQAFLDSNGGAVASDDCSAITWTNVIAPFTSSCGNTKFTKVTFIATDACGNSASTISGFYIIDSTPPTITGAAENVTVDCNDDVESEYNSWILNNGNATAEDICTDLIYWTIDESAPISDACGNAGVRTVTFTVTDDCNNASSTTATFTIEDTSPPVITSPANNLNVECDGTGNQAELDAYIASNGGAMAMDDCGEITWTSEIQPFTESCGNTRFAKIIFTATDSCGNSASTEGGFFIIDSTPPTITAAEDVIVECGDDVESAYDDWIANNGNAMATDECSDIITWTIDDSAGMTDGCGETGVRTVIFTATDDCSNSASTTATFTIVDTTPPMIDTDATSINAQCDSEEGTNSLQAWLNNNGGATASDNCGSVTWSNDYGQTEVDGCSTAVTVTFTATDECGNSSSTSASYTIADTEAPVIEVEAVDVSVECSANNVQDIIDDFINSNGNATATDNCSVITWSNDFTGLNNGGCKGNDLVGSALVTFTATDACGNSTSTSATIEVVDNTPPTITLNAESISVECDGTGNQQDLEDFINDNGGAEAMDECSEVTWSSQIDMTSAGCGNTSMTKIRFIATDACGNSSEAMATFTIVDTTPPSLSTEAESTSIECDGDTDTLIQEWIENNGGAVATDECSDAVEWSVVSAPVEGDECAATGSMTYTFTAMDDCGNEVSTTATLTITDSTPPMFTVPESISLECDEDINDLSLTGDVTDESDNCSVDLEATFTDSFTAGDCPGTSTVTRTWILMDDCGNTTRQVQTISVVDTTAPTFTVPESITLACDDDVQDLALTGEITDAMDNCSTELSIEFSDSTAAGDCPSESIVTRTWTVTDECGNVNTQTQSISVEDNDPPTLVGDLDENVSVTCADIPAMPSLVFEDTCTTNITVEFNEESTDASQEEYTITRTWTVTDDCGNTANFVQSISVANTAQTITATAQTRCYDEGPFNLRTLFDTDLPEGGVFTDASGSLDINGELLATDIDDQGLFTINYEIEASNDDCPTTYQLNLTLDDECVVLPAECPEDASGIDISQAVTPNGDGINDFFEVGGFDPECGFIVEVMIFNRWGAKIYENDNYQNDWGADASNASIGNDNKVPTGTYYYIINLRNSGIAPINGPIYVGTK